MAFANAVALPRSDSSHALSSMAPIVFPKGETLSRPVGEFLFSPAGGKVRPMETIDETRRARLRLLVERDTAAITGNAHRKHRHMAVFFRLSSRFPCPDTTPGGNIFSFISLLGVDIVYPLGK